MTLVRVTSADPLDGLTVRVTFTDGTRREIDLARYLRGPIFEPIRTEPSVFRSLCVVGRTIAWPNGADIDPDVLYGSFTPAWMATEAVPSAPLE